MNVSVNVTVVRGSVEKLHHTTVLVDDAAPDSLVAAVESLWNEVRQCARAGKVVYLMAPNHRFVVGVMPADILTISAVRP